MKKIIIALTLVLIFGFFFFNRERQKDFVEAPTQEKTRREIASLPPIPASNKKVVMKPVKEEKREVAQSEAKTELEEKIIEHYQNIFEETPTTVTMEFVQNVEIEEDTFTSQVKVYKINLDQGQGNKSRFLAMVDPETGSIIKTWNHTRYEFKRPLRISGEGQEFYSEL